MPQDFDSVDMSSLSKDELLEIDSLRAAGHGGQSRGITPLSRQTVGTDCARVIADGVTYSLPRVDSLAFYPTTSLRATIAAALAAKPSRIDAVMLSSRSGLPIGEDRQLLLEFANFFGQVESLPVYLHAEGSDELRRATPARLLPYAFGPNDLSLHNEG
jgi:cytidine deaminase